MPTTRRLVNECLIELGVNTPVVEHVGAYRSPTVLVDGVDVMSAATGDQLVGDACRLDPPSRQRVLTAIRASLTSRSHS